MAAARNGAEKALSRTQGAAGNASADLTGAASAGLGTARQAGAVDTSSAAAAGPLGTGATGQASPVTAAGPDVTGNSPSGDTTAAKPGLLSRMRNTFGGGQQPAVHGSAAGGADAGGDTALATGSMPGATAISGDTQGSGHASGQANAHGSANHGFSTAVQANGGAAAAANTPKH
jgi:hypothetical protein